jgi:hypothetical protein
MARDLANLKPPQIMKAKAETWSQWRLMKTLRRKTEYRRINGAASVSK